MGIKMKTMSRCQRPLTYGDLCIGDVFRSYNGDNLYIKTRETYEDYAAECADDTENYNSVKLSTGDHHWFDDDTKVEKYNKEIEIIVDPNQDFIKWD